MVVVMAPEATQADVDGIVDVVREAGGEAFGEPREYPGSSSGWSATWRPLGLLNLRSPPPE